MTTGFQRKTTMAINRRLGNTAVKEKKPRAPRVKKLKVDLTKYQPLIVDGKVNGAVKTRVFFPRTLNSRTLFHEGHIHSIEGDAVTLWDETRGELYVISIKENAVDVRIA